MNDWLIEDVIDWLKSFLHDEKEKAINVFHQEKITGKVLAKLDKSEYQYAFNKLSYGTYCSILIERDSMKETNEDIDKQTEHLRMFRSKNGNYKKNSLIGLPDSDMNPKTLKPAHHFVEIPEQEEQVKTFMACQIINFANACMNSRLNGTIHFGFSISGKVAKVTGVVMQSLDLDLAIRSEIEKLTFSDQANVYNYCISPPCYIAVSKEDNLYVVEVDVIPSASVCADNAFYIRKSPDDQFQIYNIQEGKPQELSKAQGEEYFKKKDILRQRRDNTERKMTTQFDRAYLKHRLVNLLCMGDDKLAADIYPVLFIDQPSGLETCNNEMFSFIKHIKWTAVFDFDPNASIYHFLQDKEGQNYRVLCVEEFNHENSNENLLENLRQQPWIFTNGYDDIDKNPSNDIKEWTKERNSSFFASVRYLEEKIPPGRAVFVFLRFGDSRITNEAASHCCKYFPDQFVILAKEEIHVSPLQAMLKPFVDESVIERRSVVGIDWSHLKDIFLDITGWRETSQMKIPASSGAKITLTETNVNQWTNLDILLANECSRESHTVDDAILRHRTRTQVLENFYRGEEVTWWNFWFEDQVLSRHIHKDLTRMVKDALSGRVPDTDDSVIRHVTLYHQPGSGATTIAKNVLWDLRELYRCVALKDVDIISETAEQLYQYRIYEDSNPKPLLVLLDNIDEEKMANLTASLKVKAKMFSGLSDANNTTWYVFLICTRHTNPPQDYGLHQISIWLKQELKPDEKPRFEDKESELQEMHKDDRGPNPQDMLSFNIMKNDFNEEHIKRTVKHMLKDIHDNERILLRYISFLNHFHIHHRYVPLSVFDRIMGSKSSPWGRNINSKESLWERNLSHAANILLDRKQGDDNTHVQLLGIIHPLLSKHILFMLKEENLETIGKIALDILKRKSLFLTKGAGMMLLKLLQDILTNREKGKGEIPVTKFAPLIEHIRQEESHLIALDVYQLGYELTNNAFVAQEIARFHIEYKNWEEASKFATKATDALPNNSYLWGTHAQVYRTQLKRKYESIENKREKLTVHSASDLIEIAENALEKFKKEQEVSDEETQSTIVNLAGYSGAVRTFLTLMNCMAHFESFSLEMKNRAKIEIWNTIQSGHMCESLSSLESVNGRNFIDIIKSLGECALLSYRRLADENVQLRERRQDDKSFIRRQQATNQLINLKAELNQYFGTPGMMSEDMSENDKCSYYRKCVFKLAGPSINEILDLKGQPEPLHRIKKMMLFNIKSSCCTPQDYSNLISSVLILINGNEPNIDVSYEDLITWSWNLYERRDANRKYGISSSILLEAYLYFVMVHWPRDNVSTTSEAKPKEIKKAIENWKAAFFEKYPRQAKTQKSGKPIGIHKKKETVMFHFSPNEELHSIGMYSERLNMSDDKYWQDPKTRETHQIFRGILSANGRDVTIWIPCGHIKERLLIAAAKPVENSSLFNKPVHFFLAFSWFGPKAYNITSPEATRDPSSGCASAAEKPVTEPPEQKKQAKGKRKRHGGRKR